MSIWRTVDGKVKSRSMGFVERWKTDEKSMHMLTLPHGEREGACLENVGGLRLK